MHIIDINAVIGAPTKAWRFTTEEALISCLDDYRIDAAVTCHMLADRSPEEGNARMLIGESHILWEDVCRYEVNKRACRIDLYRPAGFRFMTLYPEREELDAIVAYITPKMKQLVRR